MNIKKLFDPVVRIEKSRINPKKAKKLSPDDIMLLNLILIKNMNDVENVLHNEKYYSEKTLKEYQKIKKCLYRIHDMLEVGPDGNIDLIRETW